VLPDVKVGDSVVAGDTRVGMAQNIALLYPDQKRDADGNIVSGTRNHVHMEMFDPDYDKFGRRTFQTPQSFDRKNSMRVDFLGAMQSPPRFHQPNRQVKINIGPLSPTLDTPKIRR